MQENGIGSSKPRKREGDLGTGSPDTEHHDRHTESEDGEIPLSRKILAGLNDLDRAAGRYATQMWREATNRDEFATLPTWYRLTLLAIAALVAYKIIAPIITAVGLALHLQISDVIFGSTLFHAAEGAIRAYLNAAGPPIGVPGDVLWKAWAVSAVGLFLIACIGTRGGRIGWIVFGTITCAIAAAGGPTQSRLAVVAITAVGWSLLSILAFRRRDNYGEENDNFGTRRRKRKKESNSGNSREIAEERSHELGFDGLSHYFDQRGNLDPNILAKDLDINVDQAKKLRREIAGINRASHISPARKREAIEKARGEGADLPRLAKEYNVAPSTLKNWMNENEEFSTNDSFDASSPSSLSGGEISNGARN